MFAHQAANAAHKAGVHVITVAIGVSDMYGQKELRAITSDPDDVNLINMDDFDDLLERSDVIDAKIMEAVCNSE